MSGLKTLEDHEDLWRKIELRRCEKEKARLAPVLTRLWDGDYNLRGQVAGERSGDFELIENDAGTAQLEMPLDHYLSKWVMDFRGRAKRNVHITFDKQGARWAGCMDHYEVVREESGDAYLRIVFIHDHEQAKHILCWVCPPTDGRGVGLARSMFKSVPQTGNTISEAVDHLRPRKVVPASHAVRQPASSGDFALDAA